MFKFDVKEEIKSREIAKQYFPNYFFNLIGSCFMGYNYDDFQSEYKEYLEAYFNDKFNTEKRDFIKIGYDYLNSIYSRDSEINNRKIIVAPFNRLWKEYIQLERKIGLYKFYGKTETSKGNIQNKINKQILDQLSLFNPLIYDTCLIVSEKIKNGELSKEYVDQLLYKVENLYNKLNDTRNILSYAEDGYHEDWNHCVRSIGFSKKVSLNDLGNSSNDWRKARNDACSIILKFAYEMLEIDVATYYGTFDYKNEQYGLDKHTVQKINYFNDCIKYLQHSNNYFCYLDKEDKQEIAIQKVLKKK